MGEIVAPDLSVEFCGLRLSNPLILASGRLGETADTLIPYLEGGAAGAVTRTLRLQVGPERKIFPSPHLVIGPDAQYMLNCEWSNLIPWEYWMREGLAKLSEYGPVIVSISGRHIEDCVSLARQLDRLKVPLFEINVSCSHMAARCGRIGDDARHVSHLIRELKRAVRAPVMIKLGWSPNLPEIAQVAAKAGVDAISTTNSIGPGLDVQIENGRPALGIEGGFGGLSGKAIFPIALKCVHSVVEAVDIPVVGIGGISSYREVIKMLMVGAQCVQIYTEAFLNGPQVFSDILNDLDAYMRNRGHCFLAEIRGTSRPFLRKSTNLTPMTPIVVEEKCLACGNCLKVCLVNAIAVGQIAVIDAEKCTGCGACVYMCPPGCNALRWPSQP